MQQEQTDERIGKTDARIDEILLKIGSIEAMLEGALLTKRNRVSRKDGSVHVSPTHYVFQYRSAEGKRKWKAVPERAHKAVKRLVEAGKRYRALEAEYSALMTERSLMSDVKKKRRKPARLPRPELKNIEIFLQNLEAAPRDVNGMPEGAEKLDAQFQKAMRRDSQVFLGQLLTSFATHPEKGVHRVQTTQLLSSCGWIDVRENYIPKRASPLRASLGIRFKSTSAAREAVERCGALGGSFREGAETLRRLTGMDVKYSKLRDMTLAFGKACLAAQETPAPDVRTYTKKPTKASREVPRTLFAMLDGASANCCKADTVDVKGKNGEAGTRQVRVGVFGEYGWLDEEGRPVLWRESISYIVSGECIAEVTGLTKKHGIARGSGTVPRMQCLADGEEALERGLRDAFSHAEFTNDFYHASEHVHALCMAIGLEKKEAQKKYRFLRGLLYRIGADSVIRHVEAHYAQTLSTCETADKELEYLRKRRNNMRYGWLRRNGYLIGSGHVEAAARVLVVRRTKQAGMHWRHLNAIHMAAILAHYRSQRKAA